ncbi:thioredoxin [Sphingomonas sp.]|uniref:thioredoxin n=1 Tax=Sphingomonas sp. TaxID=28214 RepID=UPI003D6CF4A2
MSNVSKVTAATFEAEVLGAELPVLVDFYADWCGPCRGMEPALKDVAREYAGEARVVKVDVEADPELQTRYGVQGLPTLLMFNGGDVVDRITGAAPRSALAAVIEKVLDEKK